MKSVGIEFSISIEKEGKKCPVQDLQILYATSSHQIEGDQVEGPIKEGFVVQGRSKYFDIVSNKQPLRSSADTGKKPAGDKTHGEPVRTERKIPGLGTISSTVTFAGGNYGGVQIGQNFQGL